MNEKAASGRRAPATAGPASGGDLDVMEAGAKEIRLLVVDDEPEIVDEISDYLRSRGFVCVTALSASQALETFQGDTRIGVVFTDIRMPGVDGLEMLRKLRHDLPPDRHIEVIVLTGHAGRDEAIEALQAGAMDLITKPFSLMHIGPRRPARRRSRSLPLCRGAVQVLA